uniref:Uncharacterized protein n=1 Tax=Oryza meridionalis TaxID=40149 RepID=A0A0E0E9B7_9ORYZ
MAVQLHKSPKSLLEQDAHCFIQKEDSGETLELLSIEPPSQPLIEPEPCPSGPQDAVLNGCQETTAILHDASFGKVNFQAMDNLETSTLEDENDTFEHENFSLKIPQEFCLHRKSLEACPVNVTSLCEKRNHLSVLISIMFRRLVVDAFIYQKYCKLVYVVALILQQDVSMVKVVTINKALPGDAPDYLERMDSQKWRWINASTQLDQTLSLKLKLLDPPADDEIAGRLPGHLPQLDGAELDADRHAHPHRERHEPGLLLLQQLRRHGAVQPRLASEQDNGAHRAPVALVQRQEPAAAQLRAVERRRHLPAAVVVDAWSEPRSTASGGGCGGGEGSARMSGGLRRVDGDPGDRRRVSGDPGDRPRVDGEASDPPRVMGEPGGRPRIVGEPAGWRRVGESGGRRSIERRSLGGETTADRFGGGWCVRVFVQQVQ